MAGMTLEDLRNLIHREIDAKMDVVQKEAGKLDASRKLVESKLEELRSTAEIEAKTFWQTHGRVIIVAGCMGLALGLLAGLALSWAWRAVV
jgi:hypothetical protein